MSNFDESKVKRDDSGQFAKQSGGEAGSGEAADKPKRSNPKPGTPEFVREAEERTKDHVDSYSQIKAEMLGKNPNEPLRQVARKFFDEKLKNKAFEASFGDLGNKKVQFISSNFHELSQFTDKIETKADLFPHLTEILQSGDYLGAIDRPEHKGQYKKFHAFYKEVKIQREGKDINVKAIIDVAELNNSEFAYHLNHEGYFTWENKLEHLQEAEKNGKLQHGIGIKKALTQNTMAGGFPTKCSSLNALDSSMQPKQSEVNLFIVEAYDPKTGEKYPEMMDVSPETATEITGGGGSGGSTGGSSASGETRERQVENMKAENETAVEARIKIHFNRSSRRGNQLNIGHGRLNHCRQLKNGLRALG